MNRFKIIKIYTVFTQQQDTNLFKFPWTINWNICRDIRHGAKI